eukprot:CAMPEP_0181296424 /NCGR_PEP_ID=MMETSP1101-20121128/4696_1 /TAXON_ID=46948 /ORGANISM="Rhodomonas abbreviata, Strain Caron Lab Isolate" /LENGTH=187 /DNA_ID=CAMNT_0023401287 /DNA_START=28 /DNA_END=589 /DNA_ORIENTATION=+
MNIQDFAMHTGLGFAEQTWQKPELYSVDDSDFPASNRDYPCGTGSEVAHKLMMKAGWRPGQGMGRNNTGIKEPLSPDIRLDRTCVGHPDGKTISAEQAGDVLSSASTPRAKFPNRRMAKRQEQKESAKEEARRNAWDGNVMSPACRHDPSHRVPMRKLRDHEARCPANPINARQQKFHFDVQRMKES